MTQHTISCVNDYLYSYTLHSMGFAASYYTMLCYYTSYTAYTYHFEQEALLGSTPSSYYTSSPLSFMYSALPKDYGECIVFKIGSIWVLVLKFCIIYKIFQESNLHTMYCLLLQLSATTLFRCQIMGQWLQSWWELSWTITITLRVITCNLTGGVMLSRLQT